MNSPYRVSRMLLFGSIFMLVIVGALSGCTYGASDNLPKGKEYQVQAILEPASDGQWVIAKSDLHSDWEMYLTAGYVSAIVPDGNTLWAASNGGLLRVERDTDTLFQYVAPYFPLPSNHLSDLLLYDGDLYVSGEDGLAVYDRDSTWTLYTSDEIGLEIQTPVPLMVLDDVIWMGGENGVAQLFPDGHWEVIRAGRRTFPQGSIRRISSIEGKPCLDMEYKVTCFVNDKWEVTDSPYGQLLADSYGSLWKRDINKLYKSEDQGVSWQLIFEAEDYIEPHTVDSQGRVYASVDDNDILVIENGRAIEAYTTAARMPELHYINIIKWDGLGRLWVATDGRGMTLYDGEQWRNWQENDAGMRQDAIRGLAIGEDKLYAGTYSSGGSGGVNIFDFETEQWTSYLPGESELSGGGIDGIAVDSQQRAYFPAVGAGMLDIYDHETWQHVEIPLLDDGFSAGSSEAVFDASGDYWVGISGTALPGLWKYDGRDWSRYNTGAVTAVLVDAAGRLWVATREGLVVRDLDATWYFYDNQTLLLKNDVGIDDRIKDIAVDNEGRIWILTYTDVLVFNGQECQEFFLPRGFSKYGLGADSLDFDADGNLWIGLSSGVAGYYGPVEIAPFSELRLPSSRKVAEQRVLYRE